MRLPGRRRIYEVVWVDTLAAWVVRRRSGRKVGPSHALKQDAIDAGAKKCRRIERCGGRAQLVIHNKDGQFGSERTYPDETPQRRG